MDKLLTSPIIFRFILYEFGSRSISHEQFANELSTFMFIYSDTKDVNLLLFIFWGKILGSIAYPPQ